MQAPWHPGKQTKCTMYLVGYTLAWACKVNSTGTVLLEQLDLADHFPEEREASSCCKRCSSIRPWVFTIRVLHTQLQKWCLQVHWQMRLLSFHPPHLPLQVGLDFVTLEACSSRCGGLCFSILLLSHVFLAVVVWEGLIQSLLAYYFEPELIDVRLK